MTLSVQIDDHTFNLSVDTLNKDYSQRGDFRNAVAAVSSEVEMMIYGKEL